MKDFIRPVEDSLKDGTFVKVSLAGYRGAEDLKKIHIRKIIVKREEKLSFTYQYKTRDIVKNYTFEEGLQKIAGFLEQDFGAATLFTTEFDLSFPQMKKVKATNTDVPDTSHDRSKNRQLETKGKSYLHDLGITDRDGNVLKSAQAKYRQIDKYIEILGGLVKHIAPEKISNVADMGSGKGYLTFALYDYLTRNLGLSVAIRGVEYRADLVELCNKIARRSSFDGLSFVQGTIENYNADGTDILIALHACDTATDDAIAKGIKADAALIVVAPCCHKQIRREMEAAKTAGDLDFLLKHGIFMERQAEMVTDGLRAMILEYHGYAVKVFEFVSDEHTPKNVMIVASKAAGGRNEKMLQKITDAKNTFGITRHYLEKILGL